MRFGHDTLIVLSSPPADSDHHSWTDSDRKSFRKFGWMRTGKSSDSLGDLRWVALKYFKWVGFELFLKWWCAMRLSLRPLTSHKRGRSRGNPEKLIEIKAENILEHRHEAERFKCHAGYDFL
jgi:hypothetical protein